jgi:hypothetical protein
VQTLDDEDLFLLHEATSKYAALFEGNMAEARVSPTAMALLHAALPGPGAVQYAPNPNRPEV